eukprot:maker-scaffold1209_size55568-snap-gene-0.8 protein:Tk03740 transcript:maker-scaffold1209_size55568-snap-gene-0.8-mRNA-1 annotation:"scavenger receptor class b member 1-like"
MSEGTQGTPKLGEESQAFITPKTKLVAPRNGCCHSKHTSRCCMATGVIGILFVILGIVVLLMGEGLLREKIVSSMALAEGSDRLQSWLHPPVQPHLTGYAFHVTNPEAVLAGKKPILEERGPYVYTSTNVKDSDDNIQFHDDDTITYRLRKLYHYVPELSGAGLDPERDFITIPNIPMWTGMNGLRSKTGIAKSIGEGLVTSNGLGTPFINITFGGLLWGYQDELPCLKLDRPSECATGEESPFAASSGGDDFGDDEGDDWDFKRRRKRSISEEEQSKWSKIESDPNSEWYGIAKPKAEFVDCSCNWGLFRDRNVTMREPVRFFSGVGDLHMKGVVKEYNGKDHLGWWKPGSVCDQAKGQDSSTLPPGITKNDKLDIFISLMCRGIVLEYEQDVNHAGIRTLRFIPPKNALGAHDDPNPEFKNPDNECYCLEEEGFRCFKSGVLNMEPCKRETNAPLALSMPHFYDADPYYGQMVGGLKPEKEKHQFYLDVMPEFGFPLAIRPRFQLNILIGRYMSSTWEAIQGMQEELLVPFLWAQDGFDEPSEVMAEQLLFGLSAPKKVPMMGAVVCLLIGAVCLAACLGYFFWQRRTRASTKFTDEFSLEKRP